MADVVIEKIVADKDSGLGEESDFGAKEVVFGEWNRGSSI